MFGINLFYIFISDVVINFRSSLLDLLGLFLTFGDSDSFFFILVFIAAVIISTFHQKGIRKYFWYFTLN